MAPSSRRGPTTDNNIPRSGPYPCRFADDQERVSQAPLRVSDTTAVSLRELKSLDEILAMILDLIKLSRESDDGGDEDDEVCSHILFVKKSIVQWIEQSAAPKEEQALPRRSERPPSNRTSSPLRGKSASSQSASFQRPTYICKFPSNSYFAFKMPLDPQRLFELSLSELKHFDTFITSPAFLRQVAQVTDSPGYNNIELLRTCLADLVTAGERYKLHHGEQPTADWQLGIEQLIKARQRLAAIEKTTSALPTATGLRGGGRAEHSSKGDEWQQAGRECNYDPEALGIMLAQPQPYHCFGGVFRDVAQCIAFTKTLSFDELDMLHHGAFTIENLPNGKFGFVDGANAWMKKGRRGVWPGERDAGIATSVGAAPRGGLSSSAVEESRRRRRRARDEVEMHNVFVPGNFYRDFLPGDEQAMLPLTFHDTDLPDPRHTDYICPLHDTHLPDPRYTDYTSPLPDDICDDCLLSPGTVAGTYFHTFADWLILSDLFTDDELDLLTEDVLWLKGAKSGRWRTRLGPCAETKWGRRMLRERGFDSSGRKRDDGDGFSRLPSRRTHRGARSPSPQPSYTPAWDVDPPCSLGYWTAPYVNGGARGEQQRAKRRDSSIYHSDRNLPGASLEYPDENHSPYYREQYRPTHSRRARNTYRLETPLVYGTDGYNTLKSRHQIRRHDTNPSTSTSPSPSIHKNLSPHRPCAQRVNKTPPSTSPTTQHRTRRSNAPSPPSLSPPSPPSIINSSRTPTYSPTFNPGFPSPSPVSPTPVHDIPLPPLAAHRRSYSGSLRSARPLFTKKASMVAEGRMHQAYARDVEECEEEGRGCCRDV